MLSPQLLFLIPDNLEKLQEDFLLLSPEHRINAILDFAKFVIPTLKSMELTAEQDIHPTPQPDYSKLSMETLLELDNNAFKEARKKQDLLPFVR